MTRKRKRGKPKRTRYVGLFAAIAAELPNTAPEIAERIGATKHRVAVVLTRWTGDGRAVVLGARRVGPTERLCKVYGRPEHLNPPIKPRKPL